MGCAARVFAVGRRIRHVMRQAMEVERPAAEAVGERPGLIQGAPLLPPLRVQRETCWICAMHHREGESARCFSCSTRPTVWQRSCSGSQSLVERAPSIMRNHSLITTNVHWCSKYAHRRCGMGVVRTFATDCDLFCRSRLFFLFTSDRIKIILSLFVY